MRLPGWIVRTVLVTMVLVVHVQMGVLDGLVPVLVHMPFGEVEPKTDRHEQRSHD